MRALVRDLDTAIRHKRGWLDRHTHPHLFIPISISIQNKFQDKCRKISYPPYLFNFKKKIVNFLI